VSQHDDELEAAAQVLHRVPEAAQHLRAEAVAGDANHEQVVRALVEDQLDRHARVGAAQDGGVGPLLGRARVVRRDSEVLRIDVDHLPRRPGAVGGLLEERGHGATAAIEALARRLGVGGPGTGRRSGAVVAIRDFEDLHAASPMS
jgi:hypothetical protein